jgi:hypothetical protein
MSHLRDAPGKDTDVNLFKERVQDRAVPGLPNFDPNRVVRRSLERMLSPVHDADVRARLSRCMVHSLYRFSSSFHS